MPQRCTVDKAAHPTPRRDHSLKPHGVMVVPLATIEATLLRLVAERGPGRSISPTDAARALGGDHPDGWGPLMPSIRRAAINLARQGRLVILRKGKPVDPADLKGVYRLALPPD
jgi:hypothetical protein